MIKGKPGSEPKKPEPKDRPEAKKEAKPFKDRAVERALEYLRKETANLGAAPFVDLTEGIGA